MRRYRGMQMAPVFSDLALRIGHALPDGFEAAYRERVAQLYDQSLTPMPGAVEVLTALSHPKCAASNGPLAKTLHGLRASGIAHFFGENIFSSYQVGHWKPEPHLFLHAARTMNFSPDRCLVVEDSEAGLMAAEAAGMRAVYVGPTDSPPPGPAYAHVSSLHELPGVIQGATASAR